VTVPAPPDDPGAEPTRGDADSLSGPGVSDDGAAHYPQGEPTDFLAPPHGPDELGRLGSYRVLKVLGTGGMGIVFQAEDPQLRRKVALKVMKPDLAANPTARKRFLREAQTTASIKHDHIVTIYQVGEDRGVPFLAMEFLEGAPLDGWLKKGRRPDAALILRFGREIAQGLAAAHARGLIHRDIKPANIWLEAPQGRVKILDFGLARLTEGGTQLTEYGAIVGTPAYMAPEQTGNGAIDERCDLFSLGCVLYRLCSGHVPFERPDVMGTLIALAMEEPPPVRDLNPDLPPAVADLVMGLLAKNPADRPASAKAVVAAIRAIEADLKRPEPSPAGATELDATASLAPPHRRRWVAVAAGLAVVAALLAAALIYVRTDAGLLEIEVPDGAVEGLVKEGGKKIHITDRKTGKQVAEVELKAGKQTVKLDSGEYEVEPSADRAPISVKRGQTTTVTLRAAEVVAGGQPGPAEANQSFEQWLQDTAKLPAEAQLAAVMRKLRHLNPGFDGKETHKVEGSAVAELAFCSDGVADIRPVSALRGLKSLVVSGSTGGNKAQLADLSPLRSLRLTTLDCKGTQVSDLSPLLGMPLRELRFDFDPKRDAATLKSLWALEKINDQSAADFWTKHDATHAGLLAWIAEKRKLPAHQQIEVVKHKMKELNPKFDETKMQAATSGGKVRRVTFNSDEVANLAPLRVFADMDDLRCNGNWPRKGKLADLAPLQGLRLHHLEFRETRVSDLTPLRAMRLQFLSAGAAPIKDVTPLAGMPLTHFDCYWSGVSDITPLAGIAMVELHVHGCPIKDLAPVRDMPLRMLGFSPGPTVSLALLRSQWGLQDINDKPSIEFWKKADPEHAAYLDWIQTTRELPVAKQVEAVLAKLKERNPDFHGTIESPQVFDGKVIAFTVPAEGVTDLSPVRGFPKLSVLNCAGTEAQPSPLSDLSPLRGMAVDKLNVSYTAVKDLAPLRRSALKTLNCAGAPVQDLSPLIDTALQDLRCDFDPERDAAILRGIKTLQTINNTPAADFWKEDDHPR
jgi:predicted Ser/Thr protein kinase